MLLVRYWINSTRDVWKFCQIGLAPNLILSTNIYVLNFKHANDHGPKTRKDWSVAIIGSDTHTITAYYAPDILIEFVKKISWKNYCHQLVTTVGYYIFRFIIYLNNSFQSFQQF